MIISELCAAELLNVSIADLRKLIRQQAVPYTFAKDGSGVKIPNLHYLGIDSLDRYLAALNTAITLVETAQNVAGLMHLAQDIFRPFCIDWNGKFHAAKINLYLLFSGGELVYFGQTMYGEDRKKQHKASGKQFDKMLFIPVPNSIDAVQLEGRLIAAMQTKYNQCRIAKSRFFNSK